MRVSAIVTSVLIHARKEIAAGCDIILRLQHRRSAGSWSGVFISFVFSGQFYTIHFGWYLLSLKVSEAWFLFFWFPYMTHVFP